jgi:hypothetical protein
MFHNRTIGDVKGSSSAVLMVAILLASLGLLGWSVASSWIGAKDSEVARHRALDVKPDRLPPKLESEEAKASLLYPKMKVRGPMRDGSLTAKPLGR